MFSLWTSFPLEALTSYDSFLFVCFIVYPLLSPKTIATTPDLKGKSPGQPTLKVTGILQLSTSCQCIATHYNTKMSKLQLILPQCT